MRGNVSGVNIHSCTMLMELVVPTHCAQVSFPWHNYMSIFWRHDTVIPGKSGGAGVLNENMLTMVMVVLWSFLCHVLLSPRTHIHTLTWLTPYTNALYMLILHMYLPPPYSLTHSHIQNPPNQLHILTHSHIRTHTQVILHSHDVSFVSECVLMIVALLYPLQYLFPVIPLLPTSMPTAENVRVHLMQAINHCVLHVHVLIAT